MTFDTELTILKREYNKKIKSIRENAPDIVGRDSNGIEEHKIDLWYRNEILRLKEKYCLSLEMR